MLLFTRMHVFFSWSYLLRYLHEPDKRVIAVYNPRVGEESFDAQKAICAWGSSEAAFDRLAGVDNNRYGQPIAKPGERMGFYDSKWPAQRRFQGELASAHGIHGFAMYYTWARNETSRILDLMLVDGCPDIPFMLIWDNAKFDYTSRDEWRLHFNWLLPFLKHKNYIHLHGKPLIMIFRATGVPQLHNILSTWQGLARAADLGALHIVQMNGEQWTPGAWELQPGIDSTAEFFPNYFPASGYAMNEVLSTNPAASSHFWGVCSSVDTTPVSTPNAATIIPSHPSLLYFWLRQNLARTPPGGFVFLNAWNEWGSGLAVEPSIQWGRRWLKAVLAAVRDEKRGHYARLGSDGYVQSVPLVAAGVELQNKGSRDKVCIVVRTYGKQATGVYNIHQLINSLLQLNHRHWTAFIVDTDVPSFFSLSEIVERYAHGGRIRILPLAATSFFTNGTSRSDVPFEMADAAIRDHCLSEDFRWMLITNGDNWYTPDALDFLPGEYDMVLMNFYSRYSVLTAIGGTRSDPDKLCCVRMESVECMVPSPVTGYVDLGAMLISVERYRRANLSFQMFNDDSTRLCGRFDTGGCHDGLMAARMRTRGWSHIGHHSRACAMHHNANPKSCEMVGGIWFDVHDPKRVGCYYATDEKIHHAFMAAHSDSSITARTACVC